jgi:hypothetical protein
MINSTKVRNQQMLSLKKFIVLAGAILFCVQVTRADVIYREVFGNLAAPTGTNSSFNIANMGWYGYWGGTAASQESATYNQFGVSAAAGDPSNLDNVNAGGPALSTTYGLGFTSGGTLTPGANSRILVGTSQYTVDPAATNIQTISFYAGSGNSGGSIPGFRIAVEIGGNWYATAQVFANTTAVGSIGSFPTGAQQQIFNWTTAASAWDTLTFVPGTSLVLGSAVGSDLPSAPITAFGLYSDPVTNAAAASTRRWDTFEIDGTAVPEPSSVALVLIGFGGLLGLRRSRKA